MWFVCMEYRRYTSYNSYVKGMTFRALQDKRRIVNYPKEHYKNGAAKSSRTWDRYKRTVRMFKNARNILESDGRISANLAPSYFVEVPYLQCAGFGVSVQISRYLLLHSQLDESE